MQTAILPGPDGNPALVVSPVWCGDEPDGLVHVVAGRHYAMCTRSVAAYTPAVIAALVDAGQHRTSEFSAVSVHHFHGASTRVPMEANAFGIRQPHLMVEILAAWEPGHDPSRHLAWADDIATALKPHALPGGYPNLLGPNDAEQIAHAYGANTARLRAAKSHYDPNGVFAAIPLPD